MSLNFLKHYQSKTVQSGPFNMSKNTIQKWRWYFVSRIQSLKEEKIVWPKEWDADNPDPKGFGPPILFTDDGDTLFPLDSKEAKKVEPTLLISVDGVHFRIKEPKHPCYSKNTKYYSHKFKTAGVNYEIAIARQQQQCCSRQESKVSSTARHHGLN